MKKIINDPKSSSTRCSTDCLLAHPAQLRPASADNRALVRADAPVAGARRHRDRRRLRPPAGVPRVRRQGPVHAVSPSATSSPRRRPSRCWPRRRPSDGGAGVLYLYGNYGGDVLNFDLAADMAELEGIQTTHRARHRRRRQPAQPERATDPARCRRHLLRLQVRRCSGRARRRPGRGGRGCPVRRGRDADHGHRPVADHPADSRQADLRAGRRGDGDRYRHPRRARDPSRCPRDRRRDHRPAAGPRSWPTSTSLRASG